MQEEKISLKIDGKVHECDAGLTILDACAKAAIDIPTLCYLKDINQEAACSICLVEVKGAKTLLRSCVTSIKQGMEILTNTSRVRNARRLNLELLLAGHPKDCLVCDRNQSCQYVIPAPTTVIARSFGRRSNLVVVWDCRVGLLSSSQ